MAKTIMVVGGSSSGKSTFAEKLAHDLEQKQASSVTYVATGTIWDYEFAKRVEKHKSRRPGNWGIIEEPCNLHKIAVTRLDNEVLLIDGIGTWVTNLMYAISPRGEAQSQDFSWNQEHEDKFAQYLRLFIEACKNFKGTIIIVADEVGMDVVPFYKEARVFRDLNGMANQQLAQYAQEVYLVVCGIPLQIK